MKSKKFGVVCMAAVGSFFIASTVLAAVPLPSKYYPENAPTITGERPTGQQDTAETDVDKARIKLTQKIVNVVLGIAGIVAIYFIVTNGLFLAASGGSEEVVTQRKKGLMWAVVGLILIILSYSIIRFIIGIPFIADEAPAPATPAASQQSAQ